MNKPCDVIKIDKNTKKIKTPNILLMTRSFEIIGKISRYDNWNISLVANGLDEISFTVNKYVNGKLCPVWDDLMDLKIVEVMGFGRFEIDVNYSDKTETVKSVHGVSLETELGQIPLYEFHVNDEDAMTMEQTDYNADDFDEHGDFIPTVLYNPNPKDEAHSLLHRVLKDKAPHWSIGYVTPYVALSENDQPEQVDKFQRTYTCDGTTIYDFLTGDVAKESNVVFVFDTINREINCYSLCDCIDQETGNLLVTGVGEDTSIFVSKRKLTDDIQITSNKDSIKNCFRVEGGDDTITAMVGAVNMNGTNYIMYFDQFQYDDMPKELVDKLKKYQEDMSSKKIQDEYYGENGIYTRLTQKYDDLSYYESEMMPDVEIKDTTAQEQYEIMKSALTNAKSPIAVSSLDNYDSKLYVGASNNIEAYANILIDARYKAEVIKDSTSYVYVKEDGKTYGVWTGNIQITRAADETDYYPKSDSDIQNKFSVYVVEDEMTYTRQKIEKALSSGDMLTVDFDVADMSDAEIKEYFDQYCLNSLKSFRDGYNSCLSILMNLDADSVVRQKLYEKYYTRFDIIDGEEGLLKIRQEQVDNIKKDIDSIIKEQQKFQSDHDFQKALGNDLYKIFCSYRREDVYKNDNYISDGLSTSECLQKAKELVAVATKEIQKACVLQRTISCSLNNLFAIPEFEPLYDKFALFNYIRVRTDDEILKLRLIGIDFSGDTIDKINVTFSEQIESVDKKMSDYESIMQQASSIATSYSSTALQAKKGETARNNLLELYYNGLSTTNIMLSNNNSNEVTITEAGIIAKRMDDEGYYGDKQLRITGNGLYLTTDAWKSVKMAIGEVYFNGDWHYGVLAPLLVGRLIATNNLIISDEKGTVRIDGDGITLDGGSIKWTTNIDASNINSKGNTLDQVINDYDDSIEDIVNNISELDDRIQTYSQSEDPSKSWKSEEYESHISDVWFDTKNNLTKIWTKDGNSYKWVVTEDANLKALATQKSTIYRTTTAPNKITYPELKSGDLWVLPANTVVGDKTYKKDTILIYNGSSWTTTTTDSAEDALSQLSDISKDGLLTPTEKVQLQYTITDIKSEYLSVCAEAKEYSVSHTDFDTAYNNLIEYITPLLSDMSKTNEIVSSTFDGYFNEYYSKRNTLTETINSKIGENLSKALSDAKQGIDDAAKALADAKNYADGLGSNYDKAGSADGVKSYVDGSFKTSLETAYEKYSDTAVSNFDKAVAEYLQVPGATTIIGGNHVISPYIEGGYLNITNGNKQVIVDPSNQTNTGYIFAVKNGTEFTVGIESSGNAFFKGDITATSLTLGGGVKIPSTKVDGLKNISSSKTQYQVGNSGTTTPTGTWLDTIPEVPSGKFLWSKITLTYTDSSTETYYSVGYNGVNGGDGTSISGVTNYYAISNSNTSYPTIGSADWGTGIKTPTNDKKYLWNYEVITYSKGNPTTTTPQVIGMYSKDGKGISSIIEKYLATNLSTGVTTSTSGWTSDVQSVSKENPYLWNYEVITYTDSTSTTINPHIVGTWGKEGDPGVSVTSVTPLYYLKSNKTAPSAPSSKVTSTSVSTGVWTTAIPTYVKDYYYFTCTQIEYSSGNPTFTPVILDNGTNAAIIQSFTTASDLAAYKTEITGENYVASADVKILETTTSNGITTQKIQVGSQQFDYVDTGDFICTDIGIGTPHTVNDGTTGSQKYVVISKEGLLTADNAVIRGSIYATNGYFSGELKAPTGTIGGWDISSTYIRKYDSATDYFMINSEDKAIYSRNEINKVVLTSGTLSFYKDEDLYTTICTGYLVSNNENVYGTDIISRKASKYIAFSDFSDITQPIRRANFIINYGLYPNRSDFIMHGDTYTNGAIRCSKLYTGIDESTFVADEYGLFVNSNSYINGDEYVNGQLTTNTIKLNNKSGANDVIVFDDYGGSHSIGIGWTGTDIQIRIDEMYFKLATK